jgi:hypothetical protein
MAALLKIDQRRVIVQPFADVDDQISSFCTAFTDLRKDFDSRLSLSTMLVLSRVTATIDAISAHLYSEATA